MARGIRWLPATLVLLVLVGMGRPWPARAQAPAELPFRNPDLPMEQRIDDLLGRLTLEEKVSLMVERAAPVPRLGIQKFPWWNEALHGVARAGRATVFPQAIALGATWDTDLMDRVSTAISDEARAMNNRSVKRGKRNIYQGLTFWSPNINIFRDPRWGRGQETYGEDPVLTGAMGVAFVKGMQGEDPHYLKTIATPKHYAVHSGPEPDRHTFDARVSETDLRETYLPAFRRTVMDAKAQSVMCAYNSFRGQPACGSDGSWGRSCAGSGASPATSSPTAARCRTSTSTTRSGRRRRRRRRWPSRPEPTSNAAAARGRPARPTRSSPSVTPSTRGA